MLRMSIITKLFDQIEELDLRVLVDNQVRESKRIEYKNELPGRRNQDRREFLADVTSFANASGGDLLYGVETESGIPVDVLGLDIPNVDEVILRLENMIQSGIDPRIPGIRIRDIPLQNGNVVIIIRIPRSWILPHMVTYQDLSRFFSRNSAGKYLLDVSEIRNLFSLSQTIPERIRSFRMERLSTINSGETPVTISNVSKLVLHLIPLNSFSISTSYDLSLISQVYPRPLYTSGWGGRYNFDGFVSYTYYRDTTTAYTYVQLFRNGVFEAVDTLLLSEGHIPSVAYERELLEIIPYYLSLQERLGVELPILIMLSLLGVNGFEMAVDRTRFWHRNATSIDRDNVIVPETMINNFNDDVNKTMKPVFDSVWNAAGWPRCFNYDEEGNWIGH